MEMYDEDLTTNSFFKKLQVDSPVLYDVATRRRWLVREFCVLYRLDVLYTLYTLTKKKHKFRCFIYFIYTNKKETQVL